MIMKTNSEYKSRVREALAGNYGRVIGPFLMYYVMMNMISAPAGSVWSLGSLRSGSVSLDSLVSLSFLSTIPLYIISALLSALFEPGLIKIVFDTVRERRSGIEDLFYCFTHRPLTVICINLWILLYTVPAMVLMGAGSLMVVLSETVLSRQVPFAASIALFSLTVVLSIIWTVYIKLSVSMVWFLYLDGPERTAGETVRESFEMTRGKKLRLLSLYLSYIIYFILGILSCGLAMIWIRPNVTGAVSLFYDDLKNDPEEKTYVSSSGNESVDYGTYHQDYWN